MLHQISAKESRPRLVIPIPVTPNAALSNLTYGFRGE